MDQTTRRLERDLRTTPTAAAAGALRQALLRGMEEGEANLYLDEVLRSLCCPRRTQRRRAGATGSMPGVYYGHLLLAQVPAALRTNGIVVTMEEARSITTYRLDGPPITTDELRYDRVKGPMIRFMLPTGFGGGPTIWRHTAEDLRQSFPSPRCNARRGDECSGHFRGGIALSFRPSFQKGRASTVVNGGGILECVGPVFFSVVRAGSAATILKPGHDARQFAVAAADLYHEVLEEVQELGPIHQTFERVREVVRLIEPNDEAWQVQSEEVSRIFNEATRRGLPLPPWHARPEESPWTPEQLEGWRQLLDEEERRARR